MPSLMASCSDSCDVLSRGSRTDWMSNVCCSSWTVVITCHERSQTPSVVKRRITPLPFSIHVYIYSNTPQCFLSKHQLVSLSVTNKSHLPFQMNKLNYQKCRKQIHQTNNIKQIKLGCLVFYL